MLSLISSSRRAVRLSTLGLASATLLAACNNDLSTGPDKNAIAKPTTPSLGLQIGAGLIVSIVDQNGALVTTLGTQLNITSSTVPMGFLAADNMAGDADPTIGIIQLNSLPVAKYQVCMTVAPTDYVMPGTVCKNANVNSFAPATAKLTVQTMPHVAWAVVDVAKGISVGGATFVLDDGTGPVLVADNSPLDLDPNPGRFEVKWQPTKVDVCPKSAPAGYGFSGGGACVTVAATPAQTTFAGAFEVK